MRVTRSEFRKAAFASWVLVFDTRFSQLESGLFVPQAVVSFPQRLRSCFLPKKNGAQRAPIIVWLGRAITELDSGVDGWDRITPLIMWTVVRSNIRFVILFAFQVNFCTKAYYQAVTAFGRASVRGPQPVLPQLHMPLQGCSMRVSTPLGPK